MLCCEPPMQPPRLREELLCLRVSFLSRVGTKHPSKTLSIRAFLTKALHNPIRFPMWGFWRPNWLELSRFGRCFPHPFAGLCWRWWIVGCSPDGVPVIRVPAIAGPMSPTSFRTAFRRFQLRDGSLGLVSLRNWTRWQHDNAGAGNGTIIDNPCWLARLKGR